MLLAHEFKAHEVVAAVKAMLSNGQQGLLKRVISLSWEMVMGNEYKVTFKLPCGCKLSMSQLINKVLEFGHKLTTDDH